MVYLAQTLQNFNSCGARRGCRGVSRYVEGYGISWFRCSKVSRFQSCLVSWPQSFKDLPNCHFIFLEDIDHISKMFKIFKICQHFCIFKVSRFIRNTFENGFEKFLGLFEVLWVLQR